MHTARHLLPTALWLIAGALAAVTVLGARQGRSHSPRTQAHTPPEHVPTSATSWEHLPPTPPETGAFPFRWSGEAPTLTHPVSEQVLIHAVNRILGSTGEDGDHDLLTGCLIEACRQGQQLGDALVLESHGELTLRTLLREHLQGQQQAGAGFERRHGPQIFVDLFSPAGPPLTFDQAWRSRISSQKAANPWTLWAQGEERSAVTTLLDVLQWSPQQERRAERILTRRQWS